MKVSIQGYIHAEPAEDWTDPAKVVRGMRLEFFQSRDMSTCGYVYVCDHTMVFDIPEEWDPRPDQISILQKREQELRAKFAEDVLKIQRAISELQAIEYTP